MKSAITPSDGAIHSCGPGVSPSTTMPANTPTTGTGNDDSDDTATGSVRARENQAQCATVPARKMLYAIANQPRPPSARISSTSGCESKNGARSAIGTQPTIVIQPVSVVGGCGGFHLRSSTVPDAHVTAAAKSIATPNGAL